MATTNSQTLNEKLKKFRSHGVTRDKNQFVHKNCEGQQWYYEQQSLGHNYRLSDIQAALGLSQLQKLDDFVARRNELASFYNERLFNTNRIALPKISDSVLSSFHLYILRIDFSNKNEKIELFKHCIKNNINLNVHYIPIHTQPFYENLGFKFGDFPVAEKYYEQAISLPIFPSLQYEDLSRITDILKEFLS